MTNSTQTKRPDQEGIAFFPARQNGKRRYYPTARIRFIEPFESQFCDGLYDVVLDGEDEPVRIIEKTFALINGGRAQ